MKKFLYRNNRQGQVQVINYPQAKPNLKLYNTTVYRYIWFGSCTCTYPAIKLHIWQQSRSQKCPKLVSFVIKTLRAQLVPLTCILYCYTSRLIVSSALCHAKSSKLFFSPARSQDVGFACRRFINSATLASCARRRQHQLSYCLL